MTVDPSRIPQHAMLAANDEFNAELGHHMNDSLVRRSIAAALDALMDDSWVRVDTDYKGGRANIRPSDVLRAVLTR